MEKLIKKYTILIITFLAFTGIITVAILQLFPTLLIKEIEEGVTQTYSESYLAMPIKFLFNIILLIIVSRDMKNISLKSNIVKVTTLFLGWFGIAIFLMSAFERLNQQSYD